jgi:hypothetical protein
MDWTVRPFAEANHANKVRLAHPERLTVGSGERFVLSAFESSSDPDGDGLSFHWFHSQEIGHRQAAIAAGSPQHPHRRFHGTRGH